MANRFASSEVNARGPDGPEPLSTTKTTTTATTATAATPMTLTTQRGHRRLPAVRWGRPFWTLLFRTRREANRFTGSPPKSPDRRASHGLAFWLYMTVRDDLSWS